MDTHTTPPVTQEHNGQRLDKFLSNFLPAISRERIKTLIDDGHIKSTPARKLTPSTKVKTGDVFTLTIPAPTPMTIEAENIPLDILYEDDDVVVVNKPAGMSVHPATGIVSSTLVNALLHHCTNLSGIGGVERPGIVHRLDKGTSGVMMIAKNDKAHKSLSEQLANRTVERFYLALCYGTPAPPTGQVEGNIGRHKVNRKKMAVLDHGGKEARTSYTTENTLADGQASLLRLKLFSGRTHQIRVHMTHIGHPLLGDPTYGRKRTIKGLSDDDSAFLSQLDHQMLHAAVLGFIHPTTGKKMHFESPLPADMKKALEILKF